MFADTGAALPWGVGTVTPHAVAQAVIKAIRRDRAEVVVAPLSLRAGAFLGALAPGPAAAVQARFGARLSARMVGRPAESPLAAGARDRTGPALDRERQAGHHPPAQLGVAGEVHLAELRRGIDPAAGQPGEQPGPQRHGGRGRPPAPVDDGRPAVDGYVNGPHAPARSARW